jgi:hypothetical protein
MASIQSELNRGWKLHQQKRLLEAERVYRQVLEIAPNDANAWCYLGMVLNDRRQYQDAVSAYERSLSIQPVFPVALNNMGNSLRYIGDIQRADDCFQKAIDLKPDYFNAFKNRGTLHAWTGNHDLALGYYSMALAINPKDAELHRNIGVIYLLLGNFEEGWPEYRWRWQVGDLHRVGTSPVWDGSDLAGKSILLTAEQGLGDTLQFVRFARLLREKGAGTLFHCPPELLALLQQSGSIGPVFPNNLPLQQQFDWQCSLLDVADQLNIDVNSIPCEDRYLQPSINLINFWKKQIHSQKRSMNIGIAWQGNPDHQADQFRSFALSYFEPLSRINDVRLFSLQRRHGLDQLSAWKGDSIVQFDQNLDTSSGAFMDTAAIVSQLDLVITCDSAVAHLSGALGIPTWILLNYIPDWRWLLDRQDSPWYPQVRLFRQPTTGDWHSVFGQVSMALEQLMASRQATGIIQP